MESNKLIIIPPGQRVRIFLFPRISLQRAWMMSTTCPTNQRHISNHWFKQHSCDESSSLFLQPLHFLNVVSCRAPSRGPTWQWHGNLNDCFPSQRELAATQQPISQKHAHSEFYIQGVIMNTVQPRYLNVSECCRDMWEVCACCLSHLSNFHVRILWIFFGKLDSSVMESYNLYKVSAAMPWVLANPVWPPIPTSAPFFSAIHTQTSAASKRKMIHLRSLQNEPP